MATKDDCMVGILRGAFDWCAKARLLVVDEFIFLIFDTETLFL
jgi:hypothetical protein